MRFAHRYELQVRIGHGGHGSVWRAEHLTLNSPVAIKLVHLDERPTETERMANRFQREARVAASIRHRNVVAITDYGRESAHLAYMVMEYLPGGTLAERMRGGFSSKELVQMVLDVLPGLIAVHGAGVVHRDIKPENIAIVDDATGSYPKLLDFGISRNLDRRSGLRSAVTTVEGVVFGTPDYMSPEQARGLADMDRRTDIYSVGVILYELLCGKLPFHGENIGDLLIDIVTGEAVPLHQLRPDLNPGLCDAVMKAMASDRRQRFQTVDAMLDELNRCMQQPWTDPAAAEAALAASERSTLAMDTPSGSTPWQDAPSTDRPITDAILSTLAGLPNKRRALGALGALAATLALMLVWWLARDEPSSTEAKAPPAIQPTPVAPPPTPSPPQPPQAPEPTTPTPQPVPAALQRPPDPTALSAPAAARARVPAQPHPQPARPTPQPGSGAKPAASRTRTPGASPRPNADAVRPSSGLIQDLDY